MNIREEKKDYTHEMMVNLIVEVLIEKKYTNIKANIKGYSSPNAIKSIMRNAQFTPDITGKGNIPVVVEIETSDSLHSPDLFSKWQTFSDYTIESSALFNIVVPKAFSEITRKKVGEANVHATVSGI